MEMRKPVDTVVHFLPTTKYIYFYSLIKETFLCTNRDLQRKSELINLKRTVDDVELIPN